MGVNRGLPQDYPSTGTPGERSDWGGTPLRRSAIAEPIERLGGGLRMTRQGGNDAV
jgi:hypothetical protein